MPTSPSNKPLVVITMGDPAGIGPEITLKAVHKFRRGVSKKIGAPSFLIVGDIGLLKKEAARLKVGIHNIFIKDMGNVNLKKFRPGVVRPEYGKAALEYITEACRIIAQAGNRRTRAALVTAPINKKAIALCHPGFIGHTEYLKEATGSRFVSMFMVSPELKVAPVTRHIPLSKVSKVLASQNIVKTALLVDKALREIFKKRSPRIGIAGLNPHAGEGMLMGDEENRIIMPAVKYLKKRISGISGPIPADALFYKARLGFFDACICMYHDQGLVPFKMLEFDRGVNMTLGLPFIRTSPDHGTAFDIAGTGRADPGSMLEALKLAVSSVAA